MRRGVTAFSQSHSVCSLAPTPSTLHRYRCAIDPRASRDHPLFSSNLKLVSSGLQNFPRINSIRCKSAGDSVAEALNERIESAVGEFLSTIGRLQAEQQKQVQEFQEEVLEKVRRAKEQAAREAMEAQGLIPKSAAAEVSSVNGVASDCASSQASSLEPKPTKDDPPHED